MVRILILDDNEERVHSVLKRIPFDVEVVVVRDASTCIDAIAGIRLDVLFLDHDLGGEVMVKEDEHGNTGTAVVRFLVDHSKHYPEIKRIVCHSMNEPARKRMVADLLKAGYHTWDAPWALWDWKLVPVLWENPDKGVPGRVKE